MTSTEEADRAGRSERPESARALLGDLVCVLSEAVTELRHKRYSAVEAKARHDLIHKNIRSLHLLMEVERKLDKELETDGENASDQELNLQNARDEIESRLARIIAAEKY